MNQTSEEDVATSNVYVEDASKAEVFEEEATSQIVTAETDDENANEERNYATVKVDMVKDKIDACDQDTSMESELQVETEKGEESDLSTQLHNMIKQSRKNRKLWEKSNTLPS